MTITKMLFLRTISMYFGTIMGLFWIVKFAFLILGFSMPLLQLMFLFLTLMVPVMGYLLTKRYREVYCFKEISFRHAFVFNILMYTFAALLAGMGHFIYFRFIDKGFLFDKYSETLETFKATLPAGMDTESLTESLSIISSLTPMQLTFQLMAQNFFYCTIIALFTALMTKKVNKNNTTN